MTTFKATTEGTDKLGLRAIKAFFSDRQTQRRAEAVERTDKIVQIIAAAISEHLPELATAKAGWNRVSQERVDIDGLVASLPELVAIESEAPESALVSPYSIGTPVAFGG